MDREPIPDDVKRFILLCIPSVPYLEAMLLCRHDAHRSWNAQDVSQRLYMSEKAAFALLEELCTAGVLEKPAEGQYRYCPQPEKLRQMIDRLAATYSTHLVDVSRLIHSKTNKNALLFADAFIWRKDS